MTGRQDRMAVYRYLQRRFRPDRRQFEQLVVEAVSALPDDIKRRIENVAIVVVDDPRGHSILGLYQGIALPERAESYHLAAPDTITIFRRPILASATTREEVLKEIRDTVVHEVGHYFGIPERELP